MSEEWKAIPDFPNYKISNYARVINTKTGNYKRLYGKRGCIQSLILYNHKVGNNSYNIAKLVYAVFNDIPYKDLLTYRVGLKDNDRTNCKLDNIIMIETKKTFKMGYKTKYSKYEKLGFKSYFIYYHRAEHNFVEALDYLVSQTKVKVWNNKTIKMKLQDLLDYKMYEKVFNIVMEKYYLKGRNNGSINFKDEQKDYMFN